MTPPTTLPNKDKKKIAKMQKAKDFDNTLFHVHGLDDHRHRRHFDARARRYGLVLSIFAL